MSCPCGTVFCWLCSEIINAVDPYEHYVSSQNCTVYKDTDQQDSLFLLLKNLVSVNPDFANDIKREFFDLIKLTLSQYKEDAQKIAGHNLKQGSKKIPVYFRHYQMYAYCKGLDVNNIYVDGDVI